MYCGKKAPDVVPVCADSVTDSVCADDGETIVTRGAATPGFRLRSRAALEPRLRPCAGRRAERTTP